MISPASDELAKCSVLSNTLQHSHTARDAECSLFKDEGWKNYHTVNNLIDALSQINAPRLRFSVCIRRPVRQYKEIAKQRNIFRFIQFRLNYESWRIAYCSMLN